MEFFKGAGRNPDEKAERRAAKEVGRKADIVIDGVYEDAFKHGYEPPYFVNIGKSPDLLSDEEYIKQVGNTAIELKLLCMDLAYDHGLSLLANTVVGENGDKPFMLRENLNVALDYRLNVENRNTGSQ